MENIKYNAMMLVREITDTLDQEMKQVVQGVLEVSYNTMLRDRKFEDLFGLAYVKGFCSGATYNESSLIQYTLNVFRDAGYIAEYFRQTDSFKVSVPQSVFVDVCKKQDDK